MSNSKFIYNNEGILAISIMALLESVEELTYSKTMLIAPLIFNSRITKFLGSNSKIRSLEEFRVKQIASISRFNDMYYNFLPVTINALVVLEDMGFIITTENSVKLKSQMIESMDMKKLGKRLNKIIKVIPKIKEILIEDELKLYYEMGVKL